MTQIVVEPKRMTILEVIVIVLGRFLSMHNNTIYLLKSYFSMMVLAYCLDQCGTTTLQLKILGVAKS